MSTQNHGALDTPMGAYVALPCQLPQAILDVMPTLRRTWHLGLEKGKPLQEHSTDTKAKDSLKALDQWYST